MILKKRRGLPLTRSGKRLAGIRNPEPKARVQLKPHLKRKS
ncbi:hypothetical protein CFter6_1199 [Collimonas fungivorans]|uniref:Uncharacterized protein n=1 Tax=Collimonas fungivorans TaxID=158899 RepID=A0A127P843_9BURK|nr:hypothetical protein CFter6_1199 [Collimonas fungivorans]